MKYQQKKTLVAVGFVIGVILALIIFKTSFATNEIVSNDQWCGPTPTEEPTPTELPDYCPEDEGYQPYGPCQEEEVSPTPTDEPEVTPTNPPSGGVGQEPAVHTDGKSDNRSDGHVSTPQPVVTLPPCSVPGNCIAK